jgi:hypothetical protein
VSEVENRHSESWVREIRMPGLTGGDWKRSQSMETSPVAYPTTVFATFFVIILDLSPSFFPQLICHFVEAFGGAVVAGHSPDNHLNKHLITMELRCFENEVGH